MADQLPLAHFSVDDVFPMLAEMSDAQGMPWDHPVLGFLASLHERFGLGVELYVFFQATFNGRIRTLADLTDRSRATFEEATWLRFGPHARDYEIPPFAQSPQEQVETFESIYAQIDRFAGPNSRSHFLRLHYFSECLESASYLSSQGVKSLLLTDKDALAYRLPAELHPALRDEGKVKHAGLTWRRSFIRLERMVKEQWNDSKLHARLDDLLERHGQAIIFTHEIDLHTPEVREMANRCLAHLESRGVQWV